LALLLVSINKYIHIKKSLLHITFDFSSRSSRYPFPFFFCYFTLYI
jgi:hypothetical protein